MQRSKDLILGEDGDTNGSDTAPRNDFSLTSFARQTLKPVSASPTRAIAHLANITALSAGSPVFPESPCSGGRPTHSWAHPARPEIGVTNLPLVATIC
jgi:hypothetical protein